MKKMFCVFIIGLLLFIMTGCNINDDSFMKIEVQQLSECKSDYGNTMGNNCNNSEQLETNLGILISLWPGGNYLISSNENKISDGISISGYQSDYNITNYQYYGSDIYCLCQDLSQNTIYKVHNNELITEKDLDEDIEYFIRYKDDLYISGMEHILKYNLKDKTVKIINDAPASVGSMCFYENKIYFCEQDFYMYEMDLDGSEKEHILEDKALYPQIKDGYLYYLSRNAGNGAYDLDATIKRADMKTWECQKVIQSAGVFNISKNQIFYVTDNENTNKRELRSYNLDNGKTIYLAEKFNSWINVEENSEWIYLAVQYDDNGEGIENPYIRVIKKDGSEEKKLKLPEKINKVEN